MKKNLSYFARLTIFFCYGLCLATSLFAKPILVDGDVNDLPAAVHSQLFGDPSFFLFTRDLSWDILSRFSKKQEGIFDGTILKSGGLRDAGIEIASIQQIVVSVVRKKSNISIRLPKKTIYEIYLDVETFRLSQDATLTMKIAGKKLPDIQNNDMLSHEERYLKIGEIELPGNVKTGFSLRVTGGKNIPTLSDGKPRFLITPKEERIKINHILTNEFSSVSKPVCLILDKPAGSFRLHNSWISAQDDTPLKRITCRLKIKLRRKGKATEKETRNESSTDVDATVGVAIFKLDEVVIEAQAIPSTTVPVNNTWLEKNITIDGTIKKHAFSFLENSLYEIEWILLEHPLATTAREMTPPPSVSFKRINPAKCLVRIQNATSPFWLIFNEAYHGKWLLFHPRENDRALFNKTWPPIAAYPAFRAEEAAHATSFTPLDVAYLARPSLPAPHVTTNGFVNGWYVIPEELGLGRDFDLVLFFSPQSYFYLGLMIAAATLCLSGVFLVLRGIVTKICHIK